MLAPEVMAAKAIGMAGTVGGAGEKAVYAANEMRWNQVTVSRWGRPGLEPGDWVMKGPANRVNYWNSGKWQPSWLFGWNEYAPFSSGVEYEVDAESLLSPTGIDAWKGTLGQRMYWPRQ